ncbi:MAG: GAF domain-containing sensor histidine kinase [Anaerolineales bacterium]|nr:GAF domain-containing sensor histidine kinase [Anaerolineales bacterium]
MLNVNAGVLFVRKNEYLSAVTWHGCDLTDLDLRISNSLIKVFESNKRLVLSVDPETFSERELLSVLDKMDMLTGFAAPLYVDDRLLGIWLIAFKEKRIFSQQDELVFLMLSENINLSIQKELLTAENQRHIREATALYDISMEIAQVLDLDRVLKKIVDEVYFLLDADVTSIGLANEEERVIRMRADHGGRVKYTNNLVHPYGYGVGGWVAVHRVPLLVCNIYKEVKQFSPLLLEVLAEEGIISTICAPMSTHRGFVGVLQASSRHESAFDQSQLDLLQTLANQAAIAIDNARLYNEQRLSNEKLQNSILTHERLLNLVLDNKGLEVITDTLSDLVNCPILVENDQFHVLCWSLKGYHPNGPENNLGLMQSSKELWPDIELADWLSTLQETKYSIRVSTPQKKQENTSRIITPITRGNMLLGYISAIEVDQPLNEQQRAAVEEASIIYALEFLKQETARASMLQHVIAAQEDERKRIARELHDETSQTLTALMMGLDALCMDMVDSPEKAAQQLAATKSIADGMLDNIHRLISNLRPSLLDDLGLIPALSWYLEHRLNPIGIAFDLIDEGLKQRLPTTVETALYRIVQEAITNIIRHARASKVSVRLAFESETLTLQIEDDGQGFDSQILQSTDLPVTSLGLWGMRERVSILKGDFHVQTAPGEGTLFTIQVPVVQVGMAENNDTRTFGG